MKHEVLLETKKVLTIDDLTKKHHVGFIDSSNERGYVAQVGGQQFLAICSTQDNVYGNKCYGDISNNPKDAIEEIKTTAYSVKKLFVFDTRKELYQWLAED